ncbi:MAG: hypothetical protein QME49_01660 [bacterium]|nr:hypothetical protein [bacterium]
MNTGAIIATKGKFIEALKKIGWTSIITTMLIAITWCSIPILIRQDKVDWNMAIKKFTSPFGAVAILGFIWTVYLIFKEIKKKT